MSQKASLMPPSAPPRKELLARVTCPHCWNSFGPEDVLWISTHTDLRGDARLDPPGSLPFALQRFLPTRFNLNGNAIDAKGQVCQDLACPRCHLNLPWPFLDTPCAFFAILGSPGSGKSFLLGAMAWTLRQTLLKNFGLDFGDADPQSNAALNQYEESLFLRPTPDKHVPVRDLIKKTQFTEESLFDTVYFGSQEMRLPKPFLFEAKVCGTHPDADKLKGTSRLICLYDTAGESFQAVSDDTDRLQTTAYIARARALFFLFDPMQDPRYYMAAKEHSGERGTGGGPIANRQETILRESAARVRRLLNLNQGTLHERPLVVVVNKWDAWKELLPLGPDENPLVVRKGRKVHSLDMDVVNKVSKSLRKLLVELCPEIVSAAESFCRKVVYLPASPLGHTPQPNADFVDPGSGIPLHSVRPCDIKPWWTEVPMLYALSREEPRFVEPVKRANLPD
jgi:hypothetical protein